MKKQTRQFATIAAIALALTAAACGDATELRWNETVTIEEAQVSSTKAMQPADLPAGELFVATGDALNDSTDPTTGEMHAAAQADIRDVSMAFGGETLEVNVIMRELIPQVLPAGTLLYSIDVMVGNLAQWSWMASGNAAEALAVRVSDPAVLSDASTSKFFLGDAAATDGVSVHAEGEYVQFVIDVNATNLTAEEIANLPISVQAQTFTTTQGHLVDAAATIHF